MNDFDRVTLPDDGAVLYFLGQAGFFLRSGGRTIVIDPYLTDSVGKGSAELSRAFPAPIEPSAFKADIFIVTHDHGDHLDPETIAGYRFRSETIFVAPRLAARRLAQLDIPAKNIVRIDSGEKVTVAGVEIEGVYAIPNTASVIDTAGYKIAFPSGRTVYHTADTGFSDLLAAAAPEAEVLLVCINGKWGNLDAAEAAKLAEAVAPQVAIPMHYDVMAVNSENPETFRYFMKAAAAVDVRIPAPLEPVIW